MTRAAIVAAIALLTTTISAVPARATDAPATVCARFAAAPVQDAALADPVLNEVSGVAASRTQPPLLWVHDDSAGAPAV